MYAAHTRTSNTYAAPIRTSEMYAAHTRTLSPENSFYHDNEMPNMDSKKKQRKESLCLQLVSELPVLVIT